MNKQILLAAAFAISLPSSASAITVTAENGYAAALASVDSANTLVLPGSWLGAGPMELIIGSSLHNVYKSPFHLAKANNLVDRDGDFYAGDEGYFSIGTSNHYKDYGSSAVLSLGVVAKTFSFLLGSPDGWNSIAFFSEGNLVETFSGGVFRPVAIEASFLTFEADGRSDYFDTVVFSATNNAIEFANIEITTVPIPATGLLLVAGLGCLGAIRRKKKSYT